MSRRRNTKEVRTQKVVLKPYSLNCNMKQVALVDQRLNELRADAKAKVEAGNLKKMPKLTIADVWKEGLYLGSQLSLRQLSLDIRDIKASQDQQVVVNQSLTDSDIALATRLKRIEDKQNEILEQQQQILNLLLGATK
ncbi:MAG TPA: hypothetical protein VM577_02185 [Anaerovoracaceae bacterium]|nr:hypothetical protein [Anaerovoracaceae bacterium]